jgi:hypothetical protein
MKRIAVGIVALALPACGGGGNDPVAPPPPPPSPAPVYLAFGITPEIGDRNVVHFAWSGGRYASRFRIEVGSASGASDLATIDVPAELDPGGYPQRLAWDWTPAPIGTLFTRMTAENTTAATPPSVEMKISSVDPRDVIEALFLGRGPLESNPVGCLRQDEMRGWPVGSNLTILVTPKVTDAQMTGIQRTVAQLPTATLGALQGNVRRVLEEHPDPATGEISIEISPEFVDRFCGGGGGCAVGRYSGPSFRSVKIVTRGDVQPYVMTHELGHGAFGLCHIHVPEGLRPGPMMGASGAVDRTGPPELEPLSIKALQAVYRAQLTAGATRREFEAAGLINPRRRGAAAGPASAAGMTVVDHGGGEIEVIKPFCLSPGPR